MLCLLLQCSALNDSTSRRIGLLSRLRVLFSRLASVSTGIVLYFARLRRCLGRDFIRLGWSGLAVIMLLGFYAYYALHGACNRIDKYSRALQRYAYTPSYTPRHGVVLGDSRAPALQAPHLAAAISKFPACRGFTFTVWTFAAKRDTIIRPCVNSYDTDVSHVRLSHS